MSEKHSIEKTRSNLPELVRKAETGRVIHMTRQGKRVAVLLGRRQYEVSRPRRFSEAWDKFVREVGLADLQIDPDEVFAGVRAEY